MMDSSGMCLCTRFTSSLIFKFYTVVNGEGILTEKLTFGTVVLRRSECRSYAPVA